MLLLAGAIASATAAMPWSNPRSPAMCMLSNQEIFELAMGFGQARAALA